MRLDLVEFLESAVEVDRIDLVHRHAIGDQREFEIVRRVVAHGARAGEFLDVPPVGPALGLVAVLEDVGAVADDRRVDRRRKDIGRAHLLGIFRAVDDLVVDLLDQLHLRGADRVLAADLGDVPLDVARIDHRAQLAEVGRARLDDLDAVLLLVGRKERLAHRRPHRTTGMVDHDLGGFGRLLPECRGGTRGDGGAGQTQGLTTAQIPDVHGALPYFFVFPGETVRAQPHGSNGIAGQSKPGQPELLFLARISAEK